MKEFEGRLKIPDAWQGEALQGLRAGEDVIIDAPTGAGKTYVFELLIANGFRGRAVYTVPTRALANDKALEWRKAGWRVGLVTGDITDNPDAPVVIATLETQKHKLLRGEGPDLLVLDEYQMLGDPSRGLNYELALATAPSPTQLLLMSGTVANPESVADWLRRLGRSVRVVATDHRPVPLSELFLEGLRESIPERIRGFWPRFVAKALKAKLGPILIFAPRRRLAESLASQLAGALPVDIPLELTAEQKETAGPRLAKMLRARVACHHSGLSYAQRAGLVEPLAKVGQLRVVVATTGLGAGVNFSLRSVLVTDREYGVREGGQLLRPDELKQMFGRAGRRGLDQHGYVLVAPERPRLHEGKSLALKRVPRLDWPSLLSVMYQAGLDGEDPVDAAEGLVTRLFSERPEALGLRDFSAPKRTEAFVAPKTVQRTVREFMSSEGLWERVRGRYPVALGQAKKVMSDGSWIGALEDPKTLQGMAPGTPCKLVINGSTQYGVEVPLAHKPSEEEGLEAKTLRLVKGVFARIRREDPPARGKRRKPWTAERVARELAPRVAGWHSATLDQVAWRGKTLVARLDFSERQILALRDRTGTFLLNPVERERELEDTSMFREPEAESGSSGRADTIADHWHRLGLIDERGRPTRRGIVSSFFSAGEGLAVAAALEESSYLIEDLVQDLANVRAGHRFEEMEVASSRLAAVCRARYGQTTVEGYLRGGVPSDYGNGAAEALAQAGIQLPAWKGRHLRPRGDRQDTFHAGDLERVVLEWRSLLNHIAHAPPYEWDRWTHLQQMAGAVLASSPTPPTLDERLPLLTASQSERVKSYLPDV